MNDLKDNKFVFFIILAMASSLAPLSVDLLAPSLPQLGKALTATPHQVANSIYSFLIGYGLSPIVWGHLSDTKGRRPILLAGMVLYCLSSLYCITASDPNTLITLRFIQGVGAAAGATIARAIIRDKYRASGTTKAISTMLSIMAIMPISAPIVGGVLAQHFSWAASFVTMSLIGIFIVVTFYFFIAETRTDISPTPSSNRMAVFDVLGNRVFIQHVLSNMFCVATMVLFVTNISQLMYDNYGLNTEQRGYVLTLFNLSIAVGTYCVWLLMPYFGPHRSILIGGLASIIGWAFIAAFAFQGIPPLIALAPALILSGLGCGVVISLSAGQSLIPFSGNSGAASSIYVIIQSLGASAISYSVGILVPKQLAAMALSLMVCATLAVMSKLLITKNTH